MARVSEDEAVVTTGARCANCATTLTGPFCAHCGQSARDFHRPLWALVSDAIGEFVSLDARFVRTLWPLLVTPGQVPKEYLSGQRVSHVPPLRAYLIAALIFFGLFTVLPTKSPPVYVFTAGSAEEAQLRASSAHGSRVTIGLPAHVWFGDRRFQEVSARARANPDAFALVSYRNIPRAFFLFVPISALLLALFYRKQGYYVDHLVFALYYHAFVFLSFALLFLLGRASLLPDLIVQPLRWALVLWVLAYLPMALRRLYGGSWTKTAFKLVGFAVLYLVGFFIIGMGFVMFMAVTTF